MTPPFNTFSPTGAPVSEMFAEEIGADGYAAEATTAIELFECISILNDSFIKDHVRLIKPLVFI